MIKPNDQAMIKPNDQDMIKSTDIESILKSDGVFISTTSGVSMYPMLRDRRDTIIVTRPKERLKKFDVALYKRGESYVLHRVIKVLPDSYIIRGDNCLAKEYGITDAEVLGVLSGFYRGCKKKEVNLQGVTYKLYSRLIVALHPLVSIKLKLRARFKRKKGGQ